MIYILNKILIKKIYVILNVLDIIVYTIIIKIKKILKTEYGIKLKKKVIFPEN